MSLHKLTAGDGYTYLTRQVAVADSTERGYSSLGDYYAAKGESPGVWAGSGLAGLTVGTHQVNGQVTEQQMRNLFGEGIHPDADVLAARLAATGVKTAALAKVGMLGQKFPELAVNTEWSEALAAGYRQYALDASRPGNESLTPDERETVRTTVADQLFQARHGRLPISSAERSGFIAQQSRPGRTAVAGYDLTFSPVKSVSALWSVAPTVVSEQIEAAHRAAVDKTTAWIENEAGYTRTGARGVAQVETRGLIMAAFTHRDSRAGDPDLHTHVAVSNKVQTADGRWLALDARMLYRITVGASEFYNTQLEVEVTERLGVEFADRSTTPGKRPIREIVGVDEQLATRWSSRRTAIDTHRAQLAKTFLAAHGRVPTTVEMIKLSQRATLATRDAKHEPRSLAEQREAWHDEAAQVLGGEQQLAAMIDRVTTPAPGEPQPVTPGLVTSIAHDVVATVSESRATWRQTNLDAEARRKVRYAGVSPAAVQDLATRVAQVAAGTEHSVPIGVDPEVAAPLPAELTRSDGTSIFRMAKGQLYTSEAILNAETRVVAAAGRHGGRTITAGDVQIAQLEWSANNAGAQLNTAQAAMVASVATDDRHVQLALAPAGTGKTTVMGVLARAWMSTGGNVLGLAPQASAAQELAAAIPGVEADTIDKLVHDLARHHPDQWQPWMRGIDANSLVIVDEAGLASTPKLDTAIRFVTARGGRVLLVGDDQQRAANGAGGILRDIEAAHGALTLTDVMRFTDPLEGQASLALRAGDTSVVGYLADRDRLIAVTPDTAADHVFTAWTADRTAGIDSIMIAPTLQMVTDLNRRARDARLTATAAPGTAAEAGREWVLPNGETVSAGDVVITKANDRRLTLGGTDFVRNNHRWTVEQVHPDGALTATELTRGVTRVLPAWYIAAGHVRLGYAHTHASVQGMTVGKAGRRQGTAHAVVTDGMTRNDLYPTLTRAVDGTTTYLVMGGQGDTHDVTTPGSISPATPAETLAKIIQTDGGSRSVTTEQRDAADPARRLGHAADAYATTVVIGADTVIGPDAIQRLTDAAEQAVPGITASPAWEVLRGHLAMRAADHRDPIDELAAAAASRELGSARDLAAVLDYRLDPTGNHGQDEGPLPWLPQAPDAVTDLPAWDTYVAARAQLVVDLAGQVATTARGWERDTAPVWAVPYLSDPDLVADLAVWRAAESVPDTDLRPAGPTPRRIAMIRRHTDLVTAALQVGGDARDHVDRWADTLAAHGVTHITTDDYWPVLSARLGVAETAGVDVPALLRTVTTDHPLPAEGAAGALWWRLAPHVGDLTIVAGRGHQLRPPWTDQLDAALGETTVATITTDRLWPVIVARVDAAARHGADPAQLATDAAWMLQATRDTIAEHELSTVLMVNITTLTDPEPIDPAAALPPDPDDADLTAPHDAHHHLADPGQHIDPAQMATAGQQPAALREPSDVDPAEPGDPFQIDQHPVPADLVDIPHPADNDLPAPEPEGAPVDELDLDQAPADLYDEAPAPDRQWTLPAEPAPDVDPAPVVPSDRRAENTAATDVVDPATVARVKAALTAADVFYRDNAAASWVPADLTARGLDPAAAGYAPGRTATVEHLRGHGFADAEILAAGLARTNDRGQLYDFFRNRATLPYTDPDGQVLGFMTRKPAADTNPANPKYLNSPDTIVFAKTRTPHGLDPAAVAALRAGADLVIVEGPLDAIAINTATATARRGAVAVATGGTALTRDHLATLDAVAPLADRQVVVVMDHDPAGRAAAARAHTVLTDAGITHPATTVPLDGIKDPAQLLTDRGPDALRQAIGDRRPLQDLVVDQIIDRWPNPNNWVEPRVHAMREAAPVIARMPADQQQRQTLRVADALGIDLFTVIDAVDQHRPTPTPPPVDQPYRGLDLPTPPTLRSSTGRRPKLATAALDGAAGTVVVDAPPAPAHATDSAPADTTQIDPAALTTTTPDSHAPDLQVPPETTAEQTATAEPAPLTVDNPERDGQHLPDEVLASEIAHLAYDQDQAEAAAARAQLHHQRTVVAVEVGDGPASQRLRAVNAAHRDKIAAIKAYRAAIQEVLAARAASVAAAVEISDVQAELDELGQGRRGGRRRDQLTGRLAELTATKDQHAAAFAAAAAIAKPLQDAAGHPETHDAAIRDAIQHREQLAGLTAQARDDDRAAVETAGRRAEQFATTAAQLRARREALVAEQQYRSAHPDPEAEQARIDAFQDRAAESDYWSQVRDRDAPAPSRPGLER